MFRGRYIVGDFIKLSEVVFQKFCSHFHQNSRGRAKSLGNYMLQVSEMYYFSRNTSQLVALFQSCSSKFLVYFQKIV